MKLNLLGTHKDQIINAIVEWKKSNTSYYFFNENKCRRDLFIVLNSIIEDLKYNTFRNITYVTSRYWWNNERQIENYELEIETYNYLIDYLLSEYSFLKEKEFYTRLIKIRNIIENTIKVGPKYMLHTHMVNYRCIVEYDTENIPEEHIIKQSLHEAWTTTPSKQQFMPYNVFVLGPNRKKIKEKIYYKSLVWESNINHTNYDVDMNDVLAVEKEFVNERSYPFYVAFKTAPYLLIFTQRVEDNPNPWQKHQIEKMGTNFEQIDNSWKNGHSRNRGKNLSLIEIGMFGQAFANLCLLHGIDISYTRCLPTTMDFWQGHDFKFLENPPQLIMTAGFGKTTRRDFHGVNYGYDLKPEFERIVKFV